MGSYKFNCWKYSYSSYYTCLTVGSNNRKCLRSHVIGKNTQIYLLLVVLKVQNTHLMAVLEWAHQWNGMNWLMHHQLPNSNTNKGSSYCKSNKDKKPV